MDMPLSARCLYFTLGMLADDDGFVGNPKSITRQCGASEEDMNTLITKKFVIRFESGVLAIKHWRMNNQIRKDRHHGTTYLEEMSIIGIDNKGAYTTNPEKMVLSLSSGNQVSTKRQPSVNQTGDKLATEVRLGKDSIDKNSKKDIVEQSPTEYQIIIDYLNQKTGKRFSDSSKSTRGHISGRLREGYTVEDFKRVIDIKTKQWLRDEKMSAYLRPETLFCASHFESYLNEGGGGVQEDDYADLRERMKKETEQNIANLTKEDYDRFN